MPNSPYYDPKIFLLEHDLDKELIQQTLELFEFICGEHELSVPEDKELKQMFIDTLDKYKDSQTISIEAIKERIAEQGYLYLTEVFNVTDENLRILASYLPMIQILKGTKPGLELIFTILNVGFEIKEWWEDPTNLEILSYILFVELVNQPVSTSIVPRIRKFSREYVYPLLTNIVLAITYKLNKTPRIGAVTYSKTALTVWQEFLWLIWSGDGSPENLWTDQKPYQDPITRKSYWQGSKNEELEWDPKTGEITISNTWSGSNDETNPRVWRFSDADDMTDGDLLEWWINKINLLGKPEESWCTEDIKEDEEPIITYWSPDTETDADGTLVRLTIIANPTSALVEINGELTYTSMVKKGTEVSYRVYDPEGEYLAQSGKLTPVKDMTISVTLTKFVAQATLTLSVLPPNADVTISTTPFQELDVNMKVESWGDTSTSENPAKISATADGQGIVLPEKYPIEYESAEAMAAADLVVTEPKVVSKTVKIGTVLYWKVSVADYYTQTGEVMMLQDVQKAITLEKIPYYTLTINPTPSNAVVKINSEERKSIMDRTGTKVTWSVSADGYVTRSGEEFLSETKTLDVALQKMPTLTINPTPSNAIVTINDKQTKTFTGTAGTQVVWSVSADGHIAQSGKTVLSTEDTTMDVNLTALNYTITVNTNIAANISLTSDKGMIDKTANTITAPYGSVITYVVDPTVDTWSASKTGTVTVTKNETVSVTFTESTKTVSLCSVSDSATGKGSTSYGSVQKIYKNSKTDTWESGDYALIGPATVKVTCKGSTSVSSGYWSGVRGSVYAFIGTSEANMTSTPVASWYESNSGTWSSLSGSETETIELAAGQTLYYFNASAGGTGSLTYSTTGMTPTVTNKVTLSVSYTRTVYV